MASILRSIRRHLLQHQFIAPGKPSHARFSTVEAVQKLEEESLPNYRASDFYPVRIGETFNSRYQILGKLGYGSFSTVWLSRDIKSDSYATLKVYTANEAPRGRATRELEIYKQINKAGKSHPGIHSVRTLLDSFEVSGPDGRQHPCIVHQPLWESLLDIQRRNPSKKYPEDLLRFALQRLLLALDFLHTECHIIHTDIKASNILVGVEDDFIFREFEDAEQRNPSTRKLDGDRIIYATRGLGVTRSPGPPVLCDFGEARYGTVENDEDIQPEVYRAPEVILEMKWSYSVDIWNVGVMVWDLFENKHMFDGIDPQTKEYSNEIHLAEMVAYMGQPPPSFVKRSGVGLDYFEESGSLKGGIEIPQLSLEGTEENLEGPQKELFLDFMRGMLQWVPEERKTAKELLQHPWLGGRLEED